MKARYTTSNSALTFEIEGENAKALFREIAGIQEVFDGHRECGVCHGTEFRYQVRDVDDNDFYELVCLNHQCRARFSFGQHKKGGGLFPKKKDADGNWIENNGWVKYQRPGDSGSLPISGSVGVCREPDMEETYQRLGARFGVHPPVSFQAALGLMMTKMEGGGSLAEFDVIQANVRAQYPKGVEQAGVKKKVLADLWNAYTKVKAELDDIPF